MNREIQASEVESLGENFAKDNDLLLEGFMAGFDKCARMFDIKILNKPEPE